MKIALLSLLSLALFAQPPQPRPPAVPLVANDPYFSVWSMADRLNTDPTRHWTGKTQALTSLARIDGATFRLMGGPDRNDKTPALEQRSLTVAPTQTTYNFEGAGIAVTLIFTTPALPHDLDILSRPITFITWNVRSVDAKNHAVQIYFEASTDLAANTPADQPVAWSRLQTKSLAILRAGTREQPVLAKSGDDLRIDWGYLYLAASQAGDIRQAANDRSVTRADFTSNGQLSAEDSFAEHNPRTRYNAVRNPVLAQSISFGTVGATSVSRHLMLAYDDLYSLEYFNRRVRPYWRRNGMEIGEMLESSLGGYDSLMTRCAEFDRQLVADLTHAGGPEYASIAALSYRQSIAAHKLAVDIDGTLLFFSKENFSNGSINTVDVFYPSAPLFLLVNPALLRGSVEPILQYGSMARWPWPYAPHDLGTYPLANGQTYGGGEKTEQNQMPVEESGNMLILVGALVKADPRNSDLAIKYWPMLTKWAEYLRDKGLDPENQLCTDDFAGHLARNANLSLKAIEGLGAYAMLASLSGHSAEAKTYRAIAEDYAQKWIRLATDGDHTVLAFGNSGTWSQKYNLVWDKILGLNLFPPEVARKEIVFYKTKQNIYGLPLDNREAYTKLDWLVWSATLANNRDDFETLIHPAYKWMNETPTRVPLTDWYMTTDGKQRGFQARSVVGGVFIKMLADPTTWAKWSHQDGR